MKIVLEDERPVSANKWWSGQHWSVRRDEAERVKWLVTAAIRDQIGTDIEPFESPVEIVFTVYFKGRMQDWSNLCVKPYEDALIGTVIQDDSPKYVPQGTLIPKKDNKNPRVEIQVLELDGSGNSSL